MLGVEELVEEQIEELVEEMVEMLEKYGKLEPKKIINIDYNKLKSGRSAKQIDKKVKEYLYVLKKDQSYV